MPYNHTLPYPPPPPCVMSFMNGPSAGAVPTKLSTPLVIVRQIASNTNSNSKKSDAINPLGCNEVEVHGQYAETSD